MHTVFMRPVVESIPTGFDDRHLPQSQQYQYHADGSQYDTYAWWSAPSWGNSYVGSSWSFDMQRSSTPWSTTVRVDQTDVAYNGSTYHTPDYDSAVFHSEMDTSHFYGSYSLWSTYEQSAYTRDVFDSNYVHFGSVEQDSVRATHYQVQTTYATSPWSSFSAYRATNTVSEYGHFEGFGVSVTTQHFERHDVYQESDWSSYLGGSQTRISGMVVDQAIDFTRVVFGGQVNESIHQESSSSWYDASWTPTASSLASGQDYSESDSYYMNAEDHGYSAVHTENAHLYQAEQYYLV